MPIADFVTKDEMQEEIERLEMRIVTGQLHDTETVKALEDVKKMVKERFIEVRGGEDIPKISEINALLRKLEGQFNDAILNVDDVGAKAVEKHLQAQDTVTGAQLKKDRIAYLASIGASIGLYTLGVVVVLLTIWNLL